MAEVNAVLMERFTFPMTGQVEGTVLSLKTIDISIEKATYPGLVSGKYALVKSVLSHRDGDSRKVEYEQTFELFDDGQLACSKCDELNADPDKPMNTVYFVVNGTTQGSYCGRTSQEIFLADRPRQKTTSAYPHAAELRQPYGFVSYRLGNGTPY